MTRSNDPYYFFFTHLSQKVNKSRISPWISPRRVDTNNVETYSTSELSVLSFDISGDQPEGTLCFTVDSGFYLLDTSSSIKISDKGLTVNTTLQPIEDYIATISTPVKYFSGMRSLKYSFTGTETLQTYPRSIERIAGVPSTVYQYSPLFSEITSFEEDSQEVTQAYSEITVDSSTIFSNQSSLDNLGSSALTTDRSTQLIDTGEFLKLDPSPLSNPVVSVLYENIPLGLGFLEWKSKTGEILSSTWVPTSDRGYLPSSRIGSDMAFVSLKEVALGILGLIAHKEEFLIDSVLRELIYISQKTKEANPSLLGLPSTLKRAASEEEVMSFKQSRNIEDQCFIGIAIIKAVRFLRDRPLGRIINLPKGAELLLLDLTEIVSLAVDESIGSSFAEFDEYGHVVDEVSLSSSYLSQLFLHSSLSIRYNFGAHQKAASLEVALQKTDLEDSESFRNIYPGQSYKGYLLSLLLWKTAYRSYPGSLEVLDLLSREYLINPFNDFDYGLIEYLVRLNPLLKEVSIDSVLERSKHIHHGVYKSLTGVSASLVATTWIRIGAIGYNILPALDFNLYSETARSFLTESYQEAKRILPFGYRWASEEASTAGKGNLGSLLYSLIYSSFGWSLQYQILKSGVFLSSAQGWALDEWGLSLNTKRPPLQSDLEFRSTLLSKVRNNQCTLLSLKELVSSLYSEKVDFVEPDIKRIEIDGKFIEWGTTPEVVSSVSVDSIIEIEKDRYPTESQGVEKVIWSEAIPKLSIYTYKYLPNFEENILGNISSSVGTSIYVCSYDEHTVRTFAY